MPVTNFQNITHELDLEERRLVPILIDGFKSHTKSNPIKAPEIIKILNSKKSEFGLKKNLSQVRLRKLVNYIRSNALHPVIATSEGYYTSFNEFEIKSQILSMQERANSIRNAANGLEKMLNTLKEKSLTI